MSISRVIEVSFGGGSIAYVKVDTAYFYNNGILFKPTDIDLPASYQVHWADSPQASSTLETIGTADGAPIPDDLWNRSRVIYGWIYLHPTEDSGVTGYEVRIYKNVRAGLPDGTEPTPAEQSVIDQTISALNTAVAKTAQDVISANQSARSASGDADRAEQARTRAETAQGKAEEAQESAERAKDDAETSERNASESERNAKGYAETASEKADSIHSMTASAQTLPAGSSASASYNAETGVMSFGIPKGDKGEKGDRGEQGIQGIQGERGLTGAKGDKGDKGDTGAQGIQGEQGIQGIQGEKGEKGEKGDKGDKGDTGEVTLEEFYKAFPTDTASGAIASFTDGADGLPLKSLVVDINPVQDLHGQDAPYPAGGGKNLASDIPSEYSRAADYWTFPLPLEQGKTYTIWCEMVSDTVTGYAMGIAKSGTRYSEFDSLNLCLTTSGSVRPLASFTVDATYTAPVLAIYAGSTQDTLAEFMSKVRFQVEEGSAKTTYAPYENLCPISGWTEVDVEQRGSNLWDEEWEVGGLDATTGGTATSANNIRAKNYIKALPNTVYYIGGPSTTMYLAFAYDANKNKLARLKFGSGNGTFTTPEGTAYIKFCTYSNYSATYNHDISINYPSTDHSYHPYTGRSITIQLGETVYGGKLDVLSGELVIDRAICVPKEVNTIGVSNNIYYWVINISNVPSPSNNKGEVASNMFRLNKAVAVGNWYITNLGRYIVCVPYDQTLITNSLINAWLAENEVQFVYELATPITIQLTPNQVNSLLGVNNLWADSGDTTCVYRADTKLYIERLTAPDSADMIADANITSGQYFMVGNSLYKATANIANGSAIVVGTNCIRKSLSEALNEINA